MTSIVHLESQNSAWDPADGEPAPPWLAVPSLRFRDGGGLLYSTLARLVSSGTARHRSELVAVTGLARSTVTRHLDALIEAGVVGEGPGVERSGPGRPPLRLSLRPEAGVVAVADVGAHSARLRIADLGQRPLATAEIRMDVADGPTAVLDRIVAGVAELRARVGRALEIRGGPPLRATAVGLPAPVDFAAGMPVRPPIMPGWDGYPVGSALGARLGCPVLIDNDVNLMALGEARSLPPGQTPLLYVKIGAGIGGGLVGADGTLHRGADGSAGDIGHLPVPDGDGVLCRCGNTGCVEAVASVTAMRERLGDASTDVVELIRRGDDAAQAVLRDAARSIGAVVALLVQVYNPARIVVGGRLATAGDDLIAGIRSVVYRRALPLATRHLTLGPSPLGPDAGGVGATVLATEHTLSPDGITALMGTRAYPTGVRSRSGSR